MRDHEPGSRPSSTTPGLRARAALIRRLRVRTPPRLPLALLLGTLAVAPRLLAAADTFPAAGGAISITPLIHASVQIEYGGKVIQVDPWSADLSKAKPADLVLITDNNPHHLDVKAIASVRKPGAPVVIPAAGAGAVPDGVVLRNGEATMAAGLAVESVAAYDIKPGQPEHPKGEASGYVLTLGGTRVYFAGVTECVPEVKALRNIDVAFMPMNIPVERMMPVDAAACTKLLKPKVVYVYHYDQDYSARVVNPRAVAQGLPGGITVAQSLARFREALQGTGIDVRMADWYPSRPAAR